MRQLDCSNFVETSSNRAVDSTRMVNDAYRRLRADAKGAGEWPARVEPAIPDGSEIDAFRDGDGVINLHPEIAHRAFELGVTEQQLHGAQVAGLAIDQRCFGAAQRVRAVCGGVQADRADSSLHDARVLAC